MKVTKYEHSCLDITEGNTRIIICPGVYSKSLTDLSNINAVVVTHVHQDHLDVDKIKAIIQTNPDVKVYTTTEVQQEVNDPAVEVVGEGDNITVGDATLEFFGKDHAVIDRSIPTINNVGVLVSGKLYYPGDSWTQCPKPHTWCAMPSHAPWAKHSDAMDFLRASQAENIFPTHNYFVNEDGMALYDRLLSGGAEATNKGYKYLKVGDSLEI